MFPAWFWKSKISTSCCFRLVRLRQFAEQQCHHVIFSRKLPKSRHEQSSTCRNLRLKWKFEDWNSSSTSENEGNLYRKYEPKTVPCSMRRFSMEKSGLRWAARTHDAKASCDSRTPAVDRKTGDFMEMVNHLHNNDVSPHWLICVLSHITYVEIVEVAALIGHGSSA